MAERVALYCHVPPPGQTIPVEVTPFSVNNFIPGGEEVAYTVNHIRLNRLGGPSGMRAEHLCQWLRYAMWEEKLDDTNWRKVIALV